MSDPQAAELTHRTEQLVLSGQKQPRGDSSLSDRGRRNAAKIDGGLKGLLEIFRNPYDPKTNPDGVVIAGLADNALLREELLQWFNNDRLKLEGPELTYGDRFFASTRLIDALCKLFNEVPVGLSHEKPKVIQKVERDNIVVGSGASGILDALFYVLCNPKEGVLLSVPYYNGFDHDLDSRAEATIVPVHTPLPETWTPSRSDSSAVSVSVAVSIVEAYEEALAKARQDGIQVKALLLCNPHNPTGLVYPRETVVALARFAAKEDLHFVVDEIYARSVYVSPDFDQQTAVKFESILTIDVEREAGLRRDRVHLVTSASKDFGINGFRLGVYVNQGSDEVISAMSSLGILSQGSAPAGALWYRWIEDETFLQWYFEENHRRMTNAYRYVVDWAKHHNIGYVPAHAGHFVMLDLSNFLGVKEEKDDKEGRAAEEKLVQRFMDNKVFVAPGTSYHHPIPGWFRFTFSLSAASIKEGLRRMEVALGLPQHIELQEMPSHTDGMVPLPESLRQLVEQGRDKSQCQAM
ncbi:unnamed protein product [Parajaminaea phylloscopi]